MRDARVPVAAALRVQRVEAVADQRQAVGGAPQPDEARRVSGQQDDLEARDVVALGHRVGDRDRAPVPHVEQEGEDRSGVRPELRVIEVVAAAVTFGVGAVVGVAQHRHVEEGRHPAMVGMAVAQQHARDPAQRGAGGGDRVGHRLDAGVEEHDPVAVAHEVDVHHLGREAAAHDPDAVGHRLGTGGHAALDARGQVEGLGHALLGGRALRRQGAELARELGAVHIGVDRADPPVADADEVDALEVDPRAVGLEAHEAAGSGEGRAGAPAHRHPIALGDGLEHREAPVGEGVEELGEEGDHLVAARRPEDAVDLHPRVRRVIALLGVALGAPHRLEVLARDARGLAGLVDVRGHRSFPLLGARTPLYA